MAAGRVEVSPGGVSKNAESYYLVAVRIVAIRASGVCVVTGPYETWSSNRRVGVDTGEVNH